MAASAMNLGALVYRQTWCFAGELDDFNPFFRAELAVLGTEGFHAGQRVSLPQYIYLKLDKVLDVLFLCPFWD